MSRVVKPKTQAGKRHIASREPKVHETSKLALIVKGGNSSSTVNQCLEDLFALKKPQALLFKRRHPVHPFEDISLLEKLSFKYDASLFAFGCHSKKRPHNIIFGRMYEHNVLDMIECGIEDYIGLPHFQSEKAVLSAKPCLVFSGEGFQTDPILSRFRNILQDMFRRETVQKVRLQGIDHVIAFTALGGKVMCRSYHIALKKSGSRTPRIELEEMGPRFSLSIRRSQLASDDLYRLAMKQPKTVKPRKRKNIKMDVFGSKVGRVHLAKQDIGHLQTRKVRGLKADGPASKRRRVE